MTHGQSQTTISNIREKRVPYVETKETWAGEWQVRKYLVPLQAAWRAAPAISEASLLYHYGLIKREDRTAQFRREGSLSLKDHYVRIGVAGSFGRVPVFHGIVTDLVFEPHGTTHGVSGNEHVKVMGLEFLLNRVVIDSAYVKQTDTVGTQLSQVIHSTHDFNLLERWGNRVVGNRTTVVDPTHNVHLFSADGGVWTNLDILNYLLKFFQPAGVAFVLSGETALLANVTQAHRLEGVTLKQAVDKLVDRHRGLGWHVRVYGNVVHIHISSTFGQPIEVDQTIFAPNPEQIRVVLDETIDFKHSVIKLHTSNQMDRIEVVGALVEACFTASYTEGSLVKGWAAQSEIDYKTDVESQDTADAGLNDEARRIDKYYAVYQRHLLSPTWDGTAKDGTETDAGQRLICIPLETDEGVLVQQKYPIFPFGRTPLRFLPFVNSDGNEFARPIAIIEDPDTPGKYIQLDQVGDDVTRPSASIRMLDDAMGFLVRSKIQHVFGKNFFDVAEPGTPPVPALGSNVTPVYDYTKLIVTWNIQLDQRLRIIRVINGNPGENVKTLTVSVEAAKLQFINPNTVFDVKNGDLSRHVGGIVRDDGARLRLIAGLAGAWYSLPRSSIQLNLSGLQFPVLVGNYISSIASSYHFAGVGTPVTSVVWRFDRDEPETVIQTGYWELDAAKIFEMPDHASPRQIAQSIRGLREDVNAMGQRLVNFDDRQPPVAQGGTGSTSTLFPQHSHQGYYDGGWGGFFAGTQ